MTSYPRQFSAAAVLAVSFVAARSTYAQDAANVADQVTIFPVPAGLQFQRAMVGAEGPVAAGPEEKLVYSNTLGTFGAALGAGNLVSDDITTTVPGGCKLRRFEFPVVGKVDPAGLGGGYTVDFAMYTNCPGSVPNSLRPGLIIPGTQGQRMFPDDSPRLISFVPAIDAPLPTNFWFGVKFSRNNAGVIIGAPALVGFSCDQIDFPGFACNANFGGFPSQPQASFNLEIYADSACADSFTGYKNSKPSGTAFNPGANIFVADDIQLGVGECQMIAYEVAVRSIGNYSLEMRSNCESGLIAGTQRAFSVGVGTEVKIARFTIDPPIALPQNFWLAAKVNNNTGGMVITGQQACIGSTLERLDTVVDNVCNQVFDLGPGIRGAFNLAVTCAGPAPVGACCDMFLTDENNDAVCREVPQMNCPFPPRFTADQPAWVEGATCDPDPFPFPCGAAACCTLDEPCLNLSKNVCMARDPLDRPRAWQRGEYCREGMQHCPFGDCLVTRTGPGCWSQECERQICILDAWCCEVEWDLLCVRHAQERCDGSRRNSTCVPSTGAHSDGPYELPANSVIQYAGRGEWLDGSGTGFSCYPEDLKHCEWYPDTLCNTDSDCYSGTCIPITDPLYQGYYPSWFQFTATNDSARVHTCTTSALAVNTIIEVFAATDHSTPYTTCSTLQSLACNDNALDCNGGVGADMCVTGLSPGETYLVKVAGVTLQDPGIIELTIESPCTTATAAVAESVIVKTSTNDGDVRKLYVVVTTPHRRRPKLESTTPTVEPARLHHEFPDDPWMPRPAAPPAGAMPHCGPWVRDGFESIQVNVDANGCNIVGDAANEPSIAVDPTNPNNIVIGWRQFDTVLSNFRQAGWAYSHDAGHTWTFPGTLDNGAWRSDPVLACDAGGRFRYHSINDGFYGTLFTSFDGGITWPSAQADIWGDKPWMTIDVGISQGRNHIYQISSNPRFVRLIETGGVLVGDSILLPRRTYLGTIAVAASGDVYVVGYDYFESGEGVTVQRSRTARNPAAALTIDYTVQVDIGDLSFGCGPNPGGLCGQPWVAANQFDGPHPTNVYLFTTSIYSYRSDHLDAIFSRSTDGGLTWSTPMRINDDPLNNGAYQWFGTMSVAPSGRIDVVWNDTRNSASYRISELFYSFSEDQGQTWSENIPVSPSFDSHIGWPNQKKIGDYYHMISDYNGVNIAYAATFNGEQDVYFLRIGPPLDCNYNGLSDRDDVISGRSDDCDRNFVPDECQSDFDGDGAIDACDDDIDNDGVPNATDACNRTGLGSPVVPNGRDFSDTTGRCSVGLPDYWRFRNCMVNGRLGFPAPAEECQSFFDYDSDGSINLRDFAGFQNAFRGSVP